MRRPPRARVLGGLAFVLGLGVLGLGVLLGGCDDTSGDAPSGPAPSPEVHAKSGPSAAPSGSAGPGQGRGDKQSGRKGRGKKRDNPIYVDGKLVGALRFQELPPSVPIHWHELDEGNQARRFAFADLLAAFGVTLDKVRAVHMYGGDARVMVIDGDEVRRAGKAIEFQFSKGTGGNPMYKHDGPVKTNTQIDKISAVAVYVEREPPTFDHGKLFLDGKPVQGIPFVDAAAEGGTRVYLDGRFLAQVKRDVLDDVEEDEARVVIAGVLRSLDVDIASLQSAQLVVRDELAATLGHCDAKDPKADAGAPAAPCIESGELAVELAAQSGGRFRVAGIGDGEPVDALLLFAKQKPVDRTGPYVAPPAR